MKKSILKSVAIALVLLLVGGFVFAGDFSARVKMTGSVWGTNGFSLNNQDQKDADLLEFSYSGERAGASFRLWTNPMSTDKVQIDVDGNGTPEDYAINGDGFVHMRKLALWFKPVDQVKLTVGDVEGALYKEQINWWQVPTGGSQADWGSWAARWAGDSTAAGNGFQADITPIDGLALTVTVAPGYGNAIDEWESANRKWGIQAKYNIAGFGSAGVAFKDQGFNAAKTIRVGAEMNSIEGLYAFLTVIARMDAAESVDGVSIDNYVAYSSGPLSVKATFPVTVRLTGDAGDDSYMTFDIKAAYGMDVVSPYLNIYNDDSVISFADFGGTLDPVIKAGVTWGYDGGSFDMALKIDHAMGSADMVWSLPFEYAVAW